MPYRMKTQRRPRSGGVRQQTAHNKWYDTPAHRKARKLVLAEEPLCAICKVAPSTVLDHIKPIRHGGEKLARSNLQGVCSRCHAKKRVSERGGW